MNGLFGPMSIFLKGSHHDIHIFCIKKHDIPQRRNRLVFFQAVPLSYKINKYPAVYSFPPQDDPPKGFFLYRTIFPIE